MGQVERDLARGWATEDGFPEDWDRWMSLAKQATKALAAAGYRVVKIDEDTKARAVEAMQAVDWPIPALKLDAALAVLEGDEHE